MVVCRSWRLCGVGRSGVVGILGKRCYQWDHQREKFDLGSDFTAGIELFAVDFDGLRADAKLLCDSL